LLIAVYLISSKSMSEAYLNLSLEGTIERSLCVYTLDL
jgi:hypothetical protein